MLNFEFLEKDVGIVSPPHCIIFQEKCFLCYILLANQISSSDCLSVAKKCLRPESAPLTNLGVRDICSFRLVLESKSGNEISKSSSLEFPEKFLANNSFSSDTEYNTSGQLNRGCIADLSLLRTVSVIGQKLREPSFWTLISISLSELHFRYRRFILVVQTK